MLAVDSQTKGAVFREGDKEARTRKTAKNRATDIVYADTIEEHVTLS